METVQARVVDRALSVLQADPRVRGVTVGGSWLTGGMDEFSDVDLTVVVDDGAHAEVMRDRLGFVAGLGDLLVGFTGEHVGEPRVIISLFDNPLLHVDIKFLRLDELTDRLEDAAVLWERDGSLSATMASAPARPSPGVDRQWIEDRFWVWVHYAGTKLGRGELFEVIGFLSYLRETVLGPMIMAAAGLPVRGVRRIEHSAPDAARGLALTVPTYDFESCLSAVRASVDMYRQLRAASAADELVRHPEAEAAAVGYLERIATTPRPAAGR